MRSLPPAAAMSAAMAALLSARGSPLETRCSRAVASSANSGSSGWSGKGEPQATSTAGTWADPYLEGSLSALHVIIGPRIQSGQHPRSGGGPVITARQADPPGGMQRRQQGLAGLGIDPDDLAARSRDWPLQQPAGSVEGTDEDKRHRGQPLGHRRRGVPGTQHDRALLGG